MLWHWLAVGYDMCSEPKYLLRRKKLNPVLSGDLLFFVNAGWLIWIQMVVDRRCWKAAAVAGSPTVSVLGLGKDGT